MVESERDMSSGLELINLFFCGYHLVHIAVHFVEDGEHVPRSMLLDLRETCAYFADRRNGYLLQRSCSPFGPFS